LISFDLNYILIKIGIFIQFLIPNDQLPIHHLINEALHHKRIGMDNKTLVEVKQENLMLVGPLNRQIGTSLNASLLNDISF